MTKKSRQAFVILRTKGAFKVKRKVFSIIFKELSVAKNCLRHKSVPLKSLLQGKSHYSYYNHSSIGTVIVVRWLQ